MYAQPNDDADLRRQGSIVTLDDPSCARLHGRRRPRRMTEELEWRHQVPRLLEAYEVGPGPSPADLI